MTEIEIRELIELIELGFSNSEILQYFQAISIGTIAAHRAHVTRGTYSGEFDGAIKQAEADLRGSKENARG